jgi:glycosyltransferase involved in cell wall biosynthesis
MKILMINKYHQITGGADTDYFATIQLLEQAGHQVVPFCMRVEGNRESPYSRYFVKGLTYRNWRSVSATTKFLTFVDGFYNLDARRQIEALIEEVKPDLAHVHNILYQLSPSVLEPLWRRSIPVVQTLHDYHVICAGGSLYAQGKLCERCKNPLQLAGCIFRRCASDSIMVSTMAVSAHIFHRVTGIYAPRVTAFTVPTRFLGRKLIEFGIQPTKLNVIPHPLDTSSLEPNYSPGGYALFVSRIVQHKGYETLIRAASRLKVRVILVGDGPQAETDRVQQLIKSCQATNVEWVGPQSSSAVAEYMRQSKFVIVPSEWYDNFPAVIREAFALGKPVIGADIGGIPELVDEETGILFEPGNVDALCDAIAELWDDDARVHRLGKNARRRAETMLSPALYLERLDQLYCRLIEERSGKSTRRFETL